MYTLSLEIINKCNLNCTYCYLGEKKNTYMSLGTAQKAIDIAVHEANKQHDRTLMVYFIGGEPLMAF
ncbi:4Fe-4S cluster-binding domain-containing protein, partial [Blautia wexlerae]